MATRLNPSAKARRNASKLNGRISVAKGKGESRDKVVKNNQLDSDEIKTSLNHKV